MFFRKRYIIEDLRCVGATSVYTAKFIFDHRDYELALKMAKIKQLGIVNLEKDHPWLTSNRYPHYKFYVKEK